jgi:predicted ATP-binding protein involved in virulence
MYLKSIALENVGPIPKIDLTLPFDGERPLPTVLVGTNGSGKTTLLSFIVKGVRKFPGNFSRRQATFPDAGAWQTIRSRNAARPSVLVNTRRLENRAGRRSGGPQQVAG